jgi:hypothetical protein
MPKQPRFNEADGMAALGICESLLIALTELKIISEKNARSLLTDVATKHNEAALRRRRPRGIRQWSGFVQRILAGKNGVRRKRRTELGRSNTHHSAQLPAVTFAMRWKNKKARNVLRTSISDLSN